MALHSEKFYLAEANEAFLELMTTFYDAQSQGGYNAQHPLCNNFVNLQGGGQIISPKTYNWRMIGMFKINVRNENNELEEMWTPLYSYSPVS